MGTFLTFVSKLDLALKYLLIILMALLLIDVSWQVLTRFLLPKPSSFTEELARFLLIWIGLLGASHAYRHRMHLGVDIFVKSMSARKAKVTTQIVQLMTLAFAISVLIYGGSKLVLLAFHLEQRSAAMQVNMGVVYMALPISGVLFAFFAIERLFGHYPGDAEQMISHTSKSKAVKAEVQ
ncbi:MULTISPECIES: TRAP transporter small permease [Alteromonadaceae]|jgi:TRAP-type C4-dicarboxylate transport system permease small subunit|uniref:TRAP transporter small permease protein n=1 Tax=Brumicola blandensis TaxID=3075611 RepID=A0AAW8QYR6_9ALTE|nr:MULTISPECIES: TRAP transporter small permease [unclassified Alteromonas]MDT0582221.1 TRAP transporter small permease [Alteromonas sp. W409]MDT0627823.1 TRAP transporter small permease [Alteromonas sp. W364]